MCKKVIKEITYCSIKDLVEGYCDLGITLNGADLINKMYELNKPKAKLIGENGNIFNLMAIARRALIAANMKEEADAMVHQVTSQKSYEDALEVIGRYVDIY